MSIYDDMRGGLGKLNNWMASSDDDVTINDMRDAMAKAGMEVAQPTDGGSVAQPSDEKPRAMFHDPYSVMDWGGWRQRPSSLTYETLRQMSTSNTIIAAIINLRTQQVASFCRAQQGKYDKGYRIILRDRRDKAKGMSPGEQQQAEEIERFLETTGVLLPNEKPSDRDSFRAFNKKAVHDILVYDQWCFEKIRDRAGRPSRFIALPSETIRPAVSDIEHMEPAELRNRVSHVQVYENTVIAEFATDDIAWCVQNPRSDLRVNGFGHSPVEKIVRLVTAWLFGFEYNTKFFTQGSAIKGLINIKGAIPDRQMRAFRRMWYSMIAGVGNAWKTPILNAEDLQWVSMHTANKDMEYSSWMDWITKLICSIYGIDPIEINFIFGNTGQTSGLGGTRPNAEEVTESKDKGLRPLLSHIEDHINTHMIFELNPDFEFAFTGYDAKAEATEMDALIQKTTAFMTIDQARAEVDMEPMPDGLGEIIRDTNWMQNKSAMDAAAQGMAPGMEGEEGGGAPPQFGGGEDDEDDEDLMAAPGMGEEAIGGGGGALPSDDDEDDHDDMLAASLRDSSTLRKSIGTQIIDIWMPGDR